MQWRDSRQQNHNCDRNFCMEKVKEKLRELRRKENVDLGNHGLNIHGKPKSLSIWAHSQRSVISQRPLCGADVKMLKLEDLNKILNLRSNSTFK